MMHQDVACEYIRLLLGAKRTEAFELITSQIESGESVESVYLDILQPAMYEIGRLWQVDAISVAEEHFCTAATQVLMAQLLTRVTGSRRNGKCMVGCCLGGELHELGMRMVCDIFEFHGWETYFMGAILPGSALVGTVILQKPDVVCLSATLPFGLDKVKDAITDIRNQLGPSAPKIIVGGLAFMINPNLGSAVGADAYASDAREAIAEAQRLTAGEETASDV